MDSVTTTGSAALTPADRDRAIARSRMFACSDVPNLERSCDRPPSTQFTIVLENLMKLRHNCVTRTSAQLSSRLHWRGPQPPAGERRPA